MIKPPILSTLNQTVNTNAVATFMEEMALQMAESAETLKASAMNNVSVAHIPAAIQGMVTRAGQIRVLAQDMRVSGGLERFDEACALAGWRPNTQTLHGFQAAH